MCRFARPFSVLLLALAFARGAVAADLFLSRSSMAVESPHARIEERLDLDLGALAGDFRLDLPDGAVYDAVRTSLERRGPQDFAWRGKLVLDGKAVGEATITRSGKHVAGAIFAPNGLYQIVPHGAGHRLIQTDDEGPACGGAVAPARILQAHAADLAPTTDSSTVAAPGKAAGPSRIDLLVVYTASALGDSSPDAFRTRIQNSVDVANTAHQNSGTNAQLNLIAVAEIGYHETGDAEGDLTWLQQDRGVASLRQSVGADVVTMVVSQMSGARGIGFVIPRGGLSREFAPYAYNDVVAYSLGSLVLAHEVGHNLGCQHEPANAPPPTDESVLFPYAYGHTVDPNFHTVMSYGTDCVSGCPWIPYFSNPGLSYGGVPIGLTNQRDNHRTVNNTRSVVASFYTPQPCRSGPTTMCLANRRYRVQATWEGGGASGAARAFARSPKYGLFAFTDPKSYDLAVKLVPNSSGGATVAWADVTGLDYSLQVIDTQRGVSEVYHNDATHCGGSDPAFGALSTAAPAAARCRPSATALCLLKRYKVEVSGPNGAVRGFVLNTASGAFYFTDKTAPDLIVRLQNLGDHVAFYYGALTSAAYSVTLTDTAGGVAKTYNSPEGANCGGRDDHAF